MGSGRWSQKDKKYCKPASEGAEHAATNMGRANEHVNDAIAACVSAGLFVPDESTSDESVRRLIKIASGDEQQVNYTPDTMGTAASKRLFPHGSSLYRAFENSLNGETEMNELKIKLKKEKNRIAAKKSREKKAIYMIELEKREIALSAEVAHLRSILGDTENVLESLLLLVRDLLLVKPADKSTDNYQAQTQELLRSARLESLVKKYSHILNSGLLCLLYSSEMHPEKIDFSSKLISDLLRLIRACRYS